MDDISSISLGAGELCVGGWPLQTTDARRFTFPRMVLAIVADNRSGTGFFLVYNDRRDTSSFTPDELLGRSFVVKYARLFTY